MRHYKPIYRGSLLSLMAMAGLLSSCQDDWQRPDNGLRNEGEIVFKASIDQKNETRADESGFAAGDRMGIFISDRTAGEPSLKPSGNRADNLGFTLGNDGVWVAARKVYWRDEKTKADFYGYYPFVNRTIDPTSWEFTVEKDQSVPASDAGDMSAYEASDLLIARTLGATPGQTVELNYRHALSGIKIILQKGSGFETGEWEATSKIVTVNSMVRTALVDMSTMIVTPSGTYDNRNITAADEGDDTWRAIAIPQSVAAGTPILGMTVDGISYNLTKGEKTELLPSKMHTFTVKVDKRTSSEGYVLTLADEQILPWENDKLSHQFQLNSYVTVHVEQQGTIQEAITAAGFQADKVVNLKLTGNLNEDDFRFIRENMKSLTSLNLKEVTTRDIVCHLDGWGDESEKADNVMPDGALSDMESLRRLILPDKVWKLGYRSLASLRLNTTLVLPNSLRVLCRECLNSYTDECTVIFPDSLERIESCCFYGTEFKAELKLPATLKHIGSWAFHDMPNVYGHFELPTGLEELGEFAFDNLGRDGSITGNITIPEKIERIPEKPFGISFKNRPIVTIPEGVTRIESSAFAGVRMGAPLKLPEGLTYIGNEAFYCTQFAGELKLPSTLVTLVGGAFHSSNLSGELVFPDNMTQLTQGNGYGMFAGTRITSVTFPDRFESIPNECFSSCQELKTVTIGRHLDLIGNRAFADCSQLSILTCLNPEPPRLGSGTFDNTNTDRCILQVPEQSLELYRHTEGWNKFDNITPYHELTVNIPEILSLNGGITREGIVTNEGPWEVTSCPSWCKVSPMSGGNNGERKEEITVTVNPLQKGAGDREDKIVFTLKGKNYSTNIGIRQRDYQYGEDTEIILQTASASGNEIPVFIIGDGFDADDIVNDDRYINIMNETMEHIFAIEPMKSYRSHFTVSTAVARSPQRGIMTIDGNRRLSRFNSENIYGTFEVDRWKVFDYVKNVSKHIDDGNISRALIVMVMNDNHVGGNTIIEYDGSAITCVGMSEDSYPYNQANIVARYAVGEGFARLGNEGIHHFEFLKGCACPDCRALERFNEMKSQGYYANLSLSKKMADVPWKHLIFDSRYAQTVDIYEGGYGHSRGVWRSEPQSVMSTFIPYFNTISRETIVRRIMDYAGLKFDFEQFAANDKIEIP